MKQNIELFLVSGFLGSGKTTFLRNVLTQMSGSRVGVIVNEFGSIGIDGTILQNDDLKMVEINNGSIFCACLKGGFVKTLVAFLEQPIDYLFVEASGLADPSNMESFLDQMKPYLERKPNITRNYKYRGGICIVDAMHFLQFCKVFTPVENQVIKSKFIVVNKVDSVEKQQKEEIFDKIKDLNPSAYIYPTNYGDVPLSVLDERLEVENEIAVSSNTPWNRPATYIIDMPQIDDIERVEEFCRGVSEYAVRMKGFFLTGEGYGHVDCVGNDIIVKRLGKEEKNIKSCKLIIIGRNSDKFEEKIEKIWKNTLGIPLVMIES